MTTILQYRYTENEALIGEGQLQMIDPPGPELIPEVGHKFPLYPPAEGWARIIEVDREVRRDPGKTEETHVVTITIERFSSQ